MKKYVLILGAFIVSSHIASALLVETRETNTEETNQPQSVRRIYNLERSAGTKSEAWLMLKHLKNEKEKFRSILRESAPVQDDPLPTYVDLRPNMPDCYNQEQLGSCTGNACAGLIENAEINSGMKPSITPSRLALYYNARYLENTTDRDSGASITDVVQAIGYGFPPETLWPYDNYQTTFTQQPSPLCYKDGITLFDKAQVTYTNVPQDETSIKRMLTTQGIIIGVLVYDGDNGLGSATVWKTGMVGMPAAGDRILGGHAIVLSGYDDRDTVEDGCGNQIPNPTNGYYIFRNSWGKDWGANGYGFLPQKFVQDSNYSFDFWTIAHFLNTEATSRQKCEEVLLAFQPLQRN